MQFKSLDWIWTYRRKGDGETDAYSQDGSGFARWISNPSDERIFCIMASAGNGKTTTMTYLSRSERTIQHLRYAASNNMPWKVCIAYFTFTDAFSNSFGGLLRSLVAQICISLDVPLKYVPEFTADICPESNLIHNLKALGSA